MTTTAPPTTAEAAMISLVGSLADNKAALGRALRRLGGERADPRVRRRRGGDGPGRARPRALHLPRAQGARRPTTPRSTRGRRLALLDAGLPDWTAFIAANLLVDGVLTTFVAARAESSPDPDGPARAQDPPGGGLAPRPRRGLGAAAVPLGRRAARRCSSRASQRPGQHASRWGGPAGDPGFARRASTPASSPATRPHQREQVRSRLVELLAREGVSITLPEPVDWSGWDPTGGAGRRERRADLPVLRRGGRRARRPVGRADHHRAVALPRVQLATSRPSARTSTTAREDQAARRSASSEPK